MEAEGAGRDSASALVVGFHSFIYCGFTQGAGLVLMSLCKARFCRREEGGGSLLSESYLSSAVLRALRGSGGERSHSFRKGQIGFEPRLLGTKEQCCVPPCPLLVPNRQPLWRVGTVPGPVCGGGVSGKY